jgi:restriction system protein
LIRLTKCLDERLVEHFAEHPEHLYSLPPRAFEEFVAELFDGFGFDVTLTSRTRDHGRDVIAVRHEIYDERLLIECKQYASYDRLPRLPRFHLRN